MIKNKLKFILFIIAISGVLMHILNTMILAFIGTIVKFINLNSQELKYPWIGGLNFVSFRSRYRPKWG